VRTSDHCRGPIPRPNTWLARGRLFEDKSYLSCRVRPIWFVTGTTGSPGVPPENLNQNGTGKKTPGEPGHTRYRYRTGPRGVCVPVKRHRGEPGHTRDTRDTRKHKGTQTNLTTNQTHQQQTTRTSARQPKPRPTQQPQARSRPLPAADSEEAAPSKPDPASARSQGASPRLLKGGRRTGTGMSLTTG